MSGSVCLRDDIVDDRLPSGVKVQRLGLRLAPFPFRNWSMRSMVPAGVTKVSRLPENKSSASPRLIPKNAAAWQKSLQWVKPWSRNHASRVACAHAQLFQVPISNSLAGTE
jgi:hypothetical protein